MSLADSLAQRHFSIPKCSTNAVLEGEMHEETKTIIWLASQLVRVPNSRFGGHDFESPVWWELGALT
jgi:hypothetical protein